MKYALYALIFLGIMFLLFSLGVFDGQKSPPRANQKIQQGADAARNEWQTLTDEQPPVTVAVTPLEFGKDVPVWKFQQERSYLKRSIPRHPLWNYR